MGYFIDWKTSGVYVKFTTKTQPGDIVRADTHLYKSPEFDNCTYAIWDLSCVEDFNISSWEAEMSASTDNAIAEYSALNTVILVANDQQIVNRFKEYIGHMQDKGSSWVFKIFSERHKALSWVEQVNG